MAASAARVQLSRLSRLTAGATRASIRKRMDTAPYVHASSHGSPGVERIADGLWLLRGRPPHAFNAYVMGDVLVDAATRHAARRILRQVRGAGLRAHEIGRAHV